MKKLLFLAISACLVNAGFSQQGLSKISIQQSTHLPLGSLNKNFVDRISPRGVSLDYSYFVNDNLSVGLLAGYTDLYQKTSRQTYSYPETDISAVKSHSLQMTPILLKASYSHFKDGSPIQPYAGIGAGMNLVSYQEWFGTLVDEANRLRFAVAPEIGARIAFTKYAMSGIDVSLRYHYTAFKYNDVNNLQTLSLNVGFFFFARN